MAKIKILYARDVTTKPNGFHADGGNLFLRVRDDSRVWIFRYKKAGKQTSIGLGATHTRSLTEARDLAALMRNAIANDNDPAEFVTQDKSKVMTFKECALALIESKRPSWSNEKHVQQWSNTLAQYVYPTIGNKYPADITLTDVKDVLSPLWTTKTETANRIRMRIEAVLDYAAVHENSDRRNPARWKGNLDKILAAGDTVALRLCVERLVPKTTDRPATVIMPDIIEAEATKIIPELLKSLAGQELSVSDMKSLMDIFTAHDDEVHKENKRHEKLEITTKDPIEAARQYQEIMRRSHA